MIALLERTAQSSSRQRLLGRSATFRPRSVAARAHVEPYPCNASSRRMLSTLTLYELPAHFMETLHAGHGLPWLWTIPIAALVVRAALFPTLTLGTRKAEQRRLATSPILHAQGVLLLQEATREACDQQGAFARTFKFKKWAARSAEAQRFATGLRQTLLPSLLQLPVFLWMSSNIRDMLGMPQSLFWTMFGKTDGPVKQLTTDLTEGGLPWATDLTAADPTGVMSFIVSGIMITQLTRASRAAKHMTERTTAKKLASGVIYVLALSIGPLFISAPVGILYYWACSSGLAMIFGALVDKLYPLKVFKPCKRSLPSLKDY